MPPFRRVSLGKPLPTVDEVQNPSQAEVDILVSNWDTYAPAKYRGMLSARPVGTNDPKARWFYDETRQRYISRAGHVVTPKELRAAFLAFRAALNKR